MTRMSKHDAFADSEIYDEETEVFDGVPDLVDRSRDGAQDDVALGGDFDDEIEVDQ